MDDYSERVKYLRQLCKKNSIFKHPEEIWATIEEIIETRIKENPEILTEQFKEYVNTKNIPLELEISHYIDKNKKTSKDPIMYYIKSGQGLPPLSK